MDARRFLTVLLISISLVVTGFTIRNIFAIRAESLELLELEQASPISEPAKDESSIQVILEDVLKRQDSELSRYFENSEGSFYETAEAITKRAEDLGLNISRATASGIGADRTWELSLSGGPITIMAFIDQLDSDIKHYRYPTLSIQVASSGNLEVFIAIRLPKKPDTEELSRHVDEGTKETNRISVNRLPPGKIAEYFSGFTDQKTNMPANTSVPSSTAEISSIALSSVPPVRVIGHYLTQEGVEVLAVKDMETSIVRRLSPGIEVSGWTIVQLEESRVEIDINGDTVSVPLEQDK